MNKIRKISLLAVIALCLASCSILTSATDKGKPVASTQKQATTIAAPSAPKTEDATSVAPANNAFMSDFAAKVQGEWIIVSAGQYKISQDDEMPYLNFSVSDGKFYSSNGCNVLNGTFVFSGVSDITFQNVLSTMKYCPDIKYEQAINAVIKDGNTVTTEFENIGNETFLYLLGKNKYKLMTLRRHNMERLSGQWEVIQVDNQNIDNPNINIFLDIPALTIHGNTGCNFFNGNIYIDADTPNSISFSQMAATMKACPDSEIEMAMLVALEQTHSYSLSGGEVIHFLDQKGKRVMTLRRAQDTPLPTF